MSALRRAASPIAFCSAGRAGGRGRRRLRPARRAPARRPSVYVIERLNARAMGPGDLPFAPSLATVDVSFISLAKVCRRSPRCLEPGGEVLAMVKPQFELGKERVGRGVVRDPADRREAILWSPTPRASWACQCAASPPPGCPARRATARPLSGAGARARVDDLEAAVAAAVEEDA